MLIIVDSLSARAAEPNPPAHDAPPSTLRYASGVPRAVLRQGSLLFACAASVAFAAACQTWLMFGEEHLSEPSAVSDAGDAGVARDGATESSTEGGTCENIVSDFEDVPNSLQGWRTTLEGDASIEFFDAASPASRAVRLTATQADGEAVLLLERPSAGIRSIDIRALVRVVAADDAAPQAVIRVQQQREDGGFVSAVDFFRAPKDAVEVVFSNSNDELTLLLRNGTPGVLSGWQKLALHVEDGKVTASVHGDPLSMVASLPSTKPDPSASLTTAVHVGVVYVSGPTRTVIELDDLSVSICH